MSPMQLVYVRNVRKAKSANLIAFGLGAVATSALTTGAPMPAQLIPVAGSAAAAMWWIARRLAATPDPVGPAQMLGEELAISGSELALPSRLRNDPTIARIVEVCQGTLRDQVILDVNSVQFERSSAEQIVIEFGLKCVSSGAFTSSGLQRRVQDAIRKSVPAPSGAGAWKMTPDVKADFLRFSCVKDIPDQVYPPKWPVVSSLEEAGRICRDLTWRLGVAADGSVELPVKTFPHGAVFSPTGGGKSILIKANIERWRAAGAICLLGDGKGTDYVTYRNRPGVVAVGSGGEGGNGMYYYAVVELAHRIMNTRRKSGAKRKLANPNGWEDVPSVLLVLDELKSMLGVWSSSDHLDADEKRFLYKRIDEIGSIGRQPRVNMLMATQDLYDDSIRGKWLNNARLRVCLAKPEPMEVKKGFQPMLRDEVLRVAAGFDDTLPGRAMIAAYDSESGSTAVKEFQGYYGYSPGEPFPKDSQGTTEWTEFKTAVSDQIPRLHPRLWFRLDEPSLAQQELESSENAEPLGFIDFELFTPTEISRLEVVNLDQKDSTGRWIPDPAMLKYDPHPENAAYVGHPPADSGPAKLPQEM